MPNYNMEILDAYNLTITAGELMRLATSAVVLIVSVDQEEDDGVVLTTTHIDRLNTIQYTEDDGYVFVFSSEVVCVAGDANDVIEFRG